MSFKKYIFLQIKISYTNMLLLREYFHELQVSLLGVQSRNILCEYSSGHDTRWISKYALDEMIS